MQASTLTKLAALAGVLAVASFLVLGFSRLVLGYETARLVAAPLFFAAFAVATVAFVASVLWKLGVFADDG